MGAILNLTHILRSGDHIICFDDLFGGTNVYLLECASRNGVQLSFVDARDPQAVLDAVKPNTRMVLIESPSNPSLKIVDIKAIAEVVKEAAPEAILVVDNTFMSAYFQKPLSLGADVSMQSLTKYMNGI